MNIITVTLLRKGSKRLKNKNILPLEGKPLYQHTVEHARALGYPYYILTDYEDLELCHGEAIRVPDEFCEDVHRSNEKILWGLKKYDLSPDWIILLQATSPRRDVGLLEQWVRQTLEKDVDVSFTAFELPQAFYYDQHGNAYNYSPSTRNYNSNKKGFIYRETGSFYMFKPGQLHKNHIMNAPRRLILRDPHCIDVDNIGDFLRLRHE